jgi:hypothetical protein
MSIRVAKKEKERASGPEPQEAWRQDKLIGGKPPVVSNADSAVSLEAAVGEFIPGANR